VIDSKRVGYELIVTNNVCNNNSGSGIEFNGFLNNCIIFNNTCHNNDYNGIGGGSFTDYIVYHSNITVSMNNISGSQQGISISIVKNLTVESNWIKNSHYGIRLEQVINANISHNEVSNIGYVGIHLLGCRNGLLEYNVVCNSTHSGISYIRGGIQFEYRRISNNNLSFNNKYGLYLAADLVNVENNTFYKNRLYGAYVIIEPGIGNGGSHIFANRFIDNNNGSHQAYSDKPNYWDNGFIGNYWSDHQGPDSNGDGIVDIPYNISGDGGLKDNYPLVFGNSNPKINSTNVLNVIYNTVYNVVYHAYDVNYDPIFWSMKTNADWLNFYSNNRTLVGYPKSQHKGFYWVNISISDGRGGKDWTNFTLEVLKPNDAPIITTTDQLSVNEDALYNVTYNASDVDPHDIHSWNFSSNATFLSFNHTIRNLTGIPDNGDVGIYWVNISVNDNNGSVVWTNFTLTVLNVNDDPVITTINQLGAVEDILYIRDYDADDIDPTDDNLRWSLNTSCFFLSINQTTGVLEGTPDDSDIGEWWVNVTVYDGVGGHDWTNFTINVTNVNDIPEILSGNIITAHEDRLYYNDYEVRDDDPPSAGDLIWWSLITTAPFLTIDNVTGNLSGTPTNDHVGRFNVGIMVTDGKGGEDSTFFILTVVNVNDAPSIKTTPETTATEDILFQIDFNATDIDPTYDDLEWAMNSSVPWLVINPDNGLLSGTPLNDHVGSWYVNVSVTDRKGGWDYIEFEVFVENINDDPIFLIESIPDAIEDQYYWKIIEAEDIDPTNDTIEFSLIKSDCNCFSINPISGNLTGLPFNEDVGRHWFVIGVIDGIGGQITKNFSFRVINVNDNPSIEPFDIPQMLEDQYIEFDLNASDIDPTYDEISWNIMKSNIDFLRIDKVTGKLYGTPENEDVGSCWILVNASDDKGGYTLENISFNVININDDPEILEFDIPDIIEDIPFFLDMEAVDIDPTNDELEWELRTNAHFIDIDPSSGNLTGTPSNDDVGTWWVNVSVSDGNGGMDQINFSLTILNVNDIPELNKTEMTLTMDEDSDGTSIDLRDVFFDIDGDVLSYDHEDSNNLTISVEGTTVMITPDPDWCGIEIVEFTASDGHGSVSLNVTIDVKPINDAPTDAKIIAGSKYVEGEKQIVDSSAVDVDIPFGDELTYSWSSDISGEIGVGQSLDLSLPAGNHLITLTVTDKEGLSVTTTKEIEVEPVEDNNGSEVGLILIIILIIVVVLAALIFGFMIIRRKRNEGPVEGDGGPNTDHVEDTIAVEEQFEDTMQQVQSPEEVNDPGMDPPMAETSFPEMNVNDGQNNELIVEEQIGNDIPMESDVIPTETDELVFQDGPENPFLGESEDLNS